MGTQEGREVTVRQSAITLSLWASLILAGGAVPCIAQEPPVQPVPAVLPVPPPPPKPVATDDQMLHKYVWSTIGFDGALAASISAGIDQVRSSPTEWGSQTNVSGYGKRWVSNYAASAIGDGAKYSVAHFFHQDPSFYKCECTGFGRRLHHAVDSPFMGRRRNGTRVVSVASLAGILASNIVPAATWYPTDGGTREGVKHAGTGVLTKIGIDIFKEFWPRR